MHGLPAARESFWHSLFGPDWPRCSGYELHRTCSACPTWAHAMVSIGAFKSNSEARRAGHRTPTTPGTYMVKKFGYPIKLVLE